MTKLMTIVEYSRHAGVTGISRHIKKGHLRAAQVFIPGRKKCLIDVEIADRILDWRRNNIGLLVSKALMGKKKGKRQYKEGSRCKVKLLSCRNCQIEFVVPPNRKKIYCSYRCLRIYQKMQRLGYVFCCQCGAELDGHDERLIGSSNAFSGDNQHDGYCKRCMKIYFLKVTGYDSRAAAFICKDCGVHFMNSKKARPGGAHICNKCYSIRHKKYVDTHPEVVERCCVNRKGKNRKYRENLSDFYVKNLLAKRNDFKASDVPQYLIDLKRAEIRLLRKLARAGYRVPNLNRTKGVL